MCTIRSRRPIALIALLLLVGGMAGLLLGLHSCYRVESVARIGLPLPPLRLTDQDGRRADLGRYSGQTLLAVFVDLECGFCQDQFDSMLELYENIAADSVAMVVVIRRDSLKAVDLPEQAACPFPIWTDAHRQLRRKLGATAVPALFFLDERGILRGKAVGYRSPGEVVQLISSSAHR